MSPHSTSEGPVGRILTPSIDAEYPVVDRAEGTLIFDESGRRYLDATSGVAVANIGHGVKSVVDAMAEQASRVAYTFRDHFASRPALALARTIATDWAPPGLGNVWLSSGGSEAIEGALRIARQYHLDNGQPSRYKVVSTWQSYHGSTMGALAAGARPPRGSFSPYFSGSWPHIEGAYCYRCAYEGSCNDCGIRCAQELETLLLREGPENFAAFIVEPVVGATTGATYPPASYFPRIREICDKYGILLIVDEVMSGFGRTGLPFAINHWGVAPDLIACGKGLGAGYYPLFATLVHDRIVEVLRSGAGTISLGNTYNANPVACAVGNAVLAFMSSNDLVRRAARMGDKLHSRLEGLYDLDVVGDVRGKGLMQGVEFVRDKKSKNPLPPSIRFGPTVRAEAMSRGLIVIAKTGTIDGTRGDHVFLAPPLTTSEDELTEIVSLLRQSIVDAVDRYADRMDIVE